MKTERQDWATYFSSFTMRNASRPTRIEIFGDDGVESCDEPMPLGGIVVEGGDTSTATIDVILAEESTRTRHWLTHVLRGVTAVETAVAANGVDEYVEFEDETGARILLLFEDIPSMAT